MACIVDTNNMVNVYALSEMMDNILPKYAQPQFLRFSTNMEVTGTFKLQKNMLKKQGYNPQTCGGDTLYYYDKKKKTYSNIDHQVYDGITNKCITF